jgi:ABC-type uncharacterized transport system permease subunit
MQIILFSLATLLYVGCAVLPARYANAIAIGTLVAWLFHAGALFSDVLVQGSLRVGFAIVLSITLWISVAAYWLENRNFALDGLRLLMLPVAAISALLPSIFPGSLVPMQDKPALFSWHITIAILAYSTLTVAAFHAVLMALQESRLHAHSVTPPHRWMAVAVERLPALLIMEKLLFRLIAIGFFLLTLTVVSGVLFSEQIFGKPLMWDHKTVFTLLSWLLFGILLAGRRWRGWRGKTALRFTLTGFSTLFLAYIGSRFVLEVVLHRTLA